MAVDPAPRTPRSAASSRGPLIAIPDRRRRLVLALHVLTGAGWLAYVAAVLILCLSAWASGEPGTAAEIWSVLAMVSDLGAGAIAFVVLGTGVVLGLSGPHGVARYWWTLAKTAAALAVIAGGLAVLRPAIARLAETGPNGGSAAAHAGLTAGSATALGLLMFAFLLSYLRPWGPTRRGHDGRPADDGLAPVRVRRVQAIAERIHCLELVGVGERLLPPFTPGAHIELELPSGLVRSYSLCSDSHDRLAYRIAVLREGPGGGSHEAHRLRPGDVVRIGRPRNNFPLGLHPYYLFIAGGIGISPIMPMIEQVDRARIPWRLVYVGRRREGMAFADQLATTWPANVVLYCTEVHGRPNLVAEMSDLASGTGVYACGPERLLAALAETAAAVAPHVELRTERFAARDSGGPFAIEAESSGVTVTVPRGRSALEVLAESGVAVESACDVGVCGTCRLRVVDGLPDHPPHVPGRTDAEGRALFYPCVGRSAGRLVVDA